MSAQPRRLPKAPKAGRAQRRPPKSTTKSTYAPVSMTTQLTSRAPVVTGGPFSKDGKTVIRHREYIADVSGSVNFAATSYAVNWASSPQPTGVTGRFYQTLDGAGSLPYEVSTRRLDPFSGKFMTDLMLSGGAVMAGNYVAGGDPVMAAVTPAEGDGTFIAKLDGPDLARSGTGTVAAMPDGSTSLITPPDVAVARNVAGFGTLGGTIAQATAGKYDSGFLVVTRGGFIVNTMDIGAVLKSNGGAGGPYSMGHLPAGSAAMPLGHDGNGSGIYYAYLRVWNSATPDNVALVPVNGSADMDTTNTATLNVTAQ